MAERSKPLNKSCERLWMSTVQVSRSEVSKGLCVNLSVIGVNFNLVEPWGLHVPLLVFRLPFSERMRRICDRGASSVASWNSAYTQPEARTRNTAGGSDPGVYTSPCLCFGFHFPSKCAESAVGVLQLWLRETLRTRSRKRNTAGGSDPGVYAPGARMTGVNTNSLKI